ncbi:hypothetical protein PAAG_01691 [Paracoccidioides lutzii Pb01]|uniref:Uncharacterized protein n=1 Tax=Paracoccidioides lutzii (strain ATCC MYA-826 / Pb01) TaxID=502779 RepID=C1GT46_PARBA|nr:hypothetical protein PAAG_01691 [Paracoccidioides lutzii Pb01]EEH39229.2 hypothetical protein PAAG_01691 [Paracoccidioides lutzii Pb01]
MRLLESCPAIKQHLDAGKVQARGDPEHSVGNISFAKAWRYEIDLKYSARGLPWDLWASVR